MGVSEVAGFLSSLVTDRNVAVAAATQNHALSALLFPYRRVPWIQLL